METTMRAELIGNMNETGGGLAVNVTGRYESNRHAIAKMEKVTFGEASKVLRTKKGGGFDVTAAELLAIYKEVVGYPEWHHAGFLPKSYGGGMKKTYFLDEVPSPETFSGWKKEYDVRQSAAAIAAKEEKKVAELEALFLKVKAKRFTRLTSAPPLSVVREEEMYGKNGWFEANSYYPCQVHYSGWFFDKKSDYRRFEKKKFPSKKSMEKAVAAMEAAAKVVAEIAAKREAFIKFMQAWATARVRAERTAQSERDKARIAAIKEEARKTPPTDVRKWIAAGCIHPAPQNILKLKQASGLTWGDFVNSWKKC